MKNKNYNLKAKKSLGQNFLKSIPALKKIVATGDVNKNDLILEIGPGRGALTKELLANGCQLIAVEKDNDLYELLKVKFEKEILSGQLKLINEDILELSILDTVSSFCSGPRFSSQILSSKVEAQPDHSQKLKLYQKFNYKILANIPYNITGAILKKFLTEKYQPNIMVLMIQNEVAKRIIANDNKQSILSISVKAYGTPKIEMKVPARYFSPAPKVDSAIISIKNISREFFTNNNLKEEKFWEIVHKGFAHKRKKLSGNLKDLVDFKEKNICELKNKRAEDLTLADWILLLKNTQNN